VSTLAAVLVALVPMFLGWRRDRAGVEYCGTKR